METLIIQILIFQISNCRYFQTTPKDLWELGKNLTLSHSDKFYNNVDQHLEIWLFFEF